MNKKIIELMEKDGRRKVKGEQVDIEQFLKLFRDKLTGQGIVFFSKDPMTLKRAALDNNINVLRELINEIIDSDEKGKDLL